MQHKHLWKFFWRYSLPVLAAGGVNLWMVDYQWENARAHPHMRAFYVILATLNAAVFIYTCKGAAQSAWAGHKLDKLDAQK